MLLLHVLLALCEQSNDEYMELFIQVVIFATTMVFLFDTREPSFEEQRLTWATYCDKHNRRGTFKRQLRMAQQSFEKLLSYIREDLEVNETMANLRGGTILPEICLYVTLRWLAGGSYLDITDVAGISRPSFYRVLWKTCKAICNCPELAIIWPKTLADCQVAAANFADISRENAILNCVGVVDGYLLRINTPSKKEAGNVKSFFSGHYQCHGLNVQAVSDHLSRFIYFAVAGPGVMGDNDACKEVDLYELIEKLPVGFCVIGDCAYSPTEHLVPIYGGVLRLRPIYDNFNYYASQLRIRIEMAFGLMQMKWGILNHPIGVKLDNIKWMIVAIARLHNFVINEREAHHDDAPSGISYLPTVPMDENGDPIILEPLSEEFPTWSQLREEMAKRVQNLGLERPSRNRIAVQSN
jgi:hypothetical protein